MALVSGLRGLANRGSIHQDWIGQDQVRRSDRQTTECKVLGEHLIGSVPSREEQGWNTAEITVEMQHCELSTLGCW